MKPKPKCARLWVALGDMLARAKHRYSGRVEIANRFDAWTSRRRITFLLRLCSSAGGALYWRARWAFNARTGAWLHYGLHQTQPRWNSAVHERSGMDRRKNNAPKSPRGRDIRIYQWWMEIHDELSCRPEPEIHYYSGFLIYFHWNTLQSNRQGYWQNGYINETSYVFAQ